MLGVRYCDSEYCEARPVFKDGPAMSCQKPRWYPDLHPDSSMEHFQAVVYQDNPGKCRQPSLKL